ncbi:MAG: DUF2867 domain-containing protein [Hyphomonadaceae bacterium]|nr:DUF2867 domain-containing protein [Hyphomonadaceae bacterium]
MSSRQTRARVTECDLPAGSALNNAFAGVDFHDSYRAPLAHADLGPPRIFHGIFSHTPVWMRAVLILRNQFARLAGLEVPRTSEIVGSRPRKRYQVGEKIGPWPIFSLTDSELVAGRNNLHMDFRVSIMKVRDGGGPGVVVSTICKVHNTFGRVYLSCVIPFHRFGVRKLMARALHAQRL